MSMEKRSILKDSIEVVNPRIVRGLIRFALFDFDGTISLIREGWQGIMIPMMVEILEHTPDHEDRSTLEKVGHRLRNTSDRKTDHISNDAALYRNHCARWKSRRPFGV